LLKNTAVSINVRRSPAGSATRQSLHASNTATSAAAGADANTFTPPQARGGSPNNAKENRTPAYSLLHIMATAD